MSDDVYWYYVLSFGLMECCIPVCSTPLVGGVYKLTIGLFTISLIIFDCLCGLVARVPGYRPRVRFPALPDFLRSSGSGAGSTQPREYN
jgi:hypothetical protein